MYQKYDGWGFGTFFTAIIMLAMLGMWKLIEVVVFDAPWVCLI